MYSRFLPLLFLITFACTQPGNESDKADAATDTTVHLGTSAESPRDKSNSLIIVPGESIGSLHLGEDAALLSQKLGKPDLSDAAMGKAWTTWLSKTTDPYNNIPELNVFTAYKDNSMTVKTVQLIRTTSPDFNVGNVKVYSPLDEIGKAFPGLQYKAHFTQVKTGKIMSLYDAEAEGIAFDITVINDKKLCTAIIIHPKNKSVMDHYIGLLTGKGWNVSNKGRNKDSSLR